MVKRNHFGGATYTRLIWSTDGAQDTFSWFRWLISTRIIRSSSCNHPHEKAIDSFSRDGHFSQFPGKLLFGNPLASTSCRRIPWQLIVTGHRCVPMRRSRFHGPAAKRNETFLLTSYLQESRILKDRSSSWHHVHEHFPVALER